MSKKKVFKDAFYGPTGEKKVVLGNVKHFGDEKDISLNKSEPGDNVGMIGVNSESLLSSATTTSKTKHINTGMVFGFLLGSPDFTINDDGIVFPPYLPIFLKKKWIDSKIIKIPVEVSVRKSFVLNINLLVVDGKSATAKTQFIRKLFSTINGFGEATTPSKFEGII
ncbi:hypothetical protein G9A89_015518 [Geosiphon pyriformis]|nr:hypothetical protein G9A89_015518 [Geosiphon pyriformis]